MPIKKSVLQNSQRISILASVAPSGEDELSANRLQTVILYSKLDSIICPADINKGRSANQSALSAYHGKSITQLKKNVLVKPVAS